MDCDRLVSQHFFTRKYQREAAILGPAPQQVVVKRRARVAGLTGRIGHRCGIPVTDIDDLSIGSASPNKEVVWAEARIIGRKTAATARISVVGMINTYVTRGKSDL